MFWRKKAFKVVNGNREDDSVRDSNLNIKVATKICTSMIFMGHPREWTNSQDLFMVRVDMDLEMIISP